MATRIYLSSTASMPSGVSNPTVGTWTETTGFDRKGASTSRGSSAMTDKTQARTASAANNTWLDRMYVMGPLAAQTFGVSTVKGTIRALESAVNDNVDAMRLLIRVVAPDGTTFRGTIYGPTNGTVAEFNTSLRAKRLATGGATTSVAVTEGDYLVIEIGATATTGGTSISTTINYGDNSATDLGDNETDTAANNPFIEFAANMKLLQRGWGQAQASIKATSRGFGQAQAQILKSAGYGQAQCFVRFYGGSGQTQVVLARSFVLPFVDTFTRSVTDGFGTSDNTDPWVLTLGTAANFDVNGTQGTIVTTSGFQIADLVKTLANKKGYEVSITFKIDKIPASSSVALYAGFIGSNGSALFPDVAGGLQITVDSASLASINIAYVVGTSGPTLSISTATLYTVKIHTILASGRTAVVKGKIYPAGAETAGWTTVGEIDATFVNGSIAGHPRIGTSAAAQANAPFTWTVDDFNIKEAWLNGTGQAQALIRTSFYAKNVMNRPNLAAYWRSGDTAGPSVLESKNSNTGTAQNGPTFGATGGIFGDSNKAITYSGASNQYISVNNHATLQLGNAGITFEARIKRSAINNASTEYIMQKGLDGDASPALMIIGGTNTLEWRSDGWGDGADSVSSLTSTSAFYTIMATKDASHNWIIYINGLPDYTVLGNPQTANDSQPFYIGQKVGSSTNGFNGTIDEVAVYIATLTAEEAWEHHTLAEIGSLIRSGQAQALIVIKGNASSQALTILRVPKRYGQAQALIASSIKQGYGQALADIKRTTVNGSVNRGSAQAQAQINQSKQQAQAQATIRIPGIGSAQAQVHIAGQFTALLDTFSRNTQDYMRHTVSSWPYGLGISENGDKWVPATNLVGVFADGERWISQGASAQRSNVLERTIVPNQTEVTFDFTFITQGGTATDAQIDLNYPAWRGPFAGLAVAVGHGNSSRESIVISLFPVSSSSLVVAPPDLRVILGVPLKIKVKFLRAQNYQDYWVKAWYPSLTSEPAWMATASQPVDNYGIGVAAMGINGGSAIQSLDNLESHDAPQVGNGQAQCLVQTNAFTAGYGQAQADIRQTYFGSGQAQADIKAVGYGFGQAQADIKAVGYGFGQAQADIKAIGYGFGQAQADIKAVGFGLGQAQADIKAQGYGLGQAQCDVKAVGRGYGQAQADIKAQGYGLGQAQCTVRGNAFGQAQCDIKTQGYGSGQAQCTVRGNAFAQAQADIKAVGYGSGQAQCDVKAIGRGFAQAQADIKAIGYGFGQAQADIKATNNGSGQAQCTVRGNAFGQAQCDVRQTYFGCGQAQADIKAIGRGFGQAQCDVKAVGYGFGQAQCDVKATGRGFGQAQCDVKAVGYGSGQAQCDVRATYNQCAQAQADIKAVGYGFGQAQCDIKTQGYGLGQAQCDVRATYYGHGQAQADIKHTYNGSGQAQCTVVGNAYGQAQCDIKQTYYGSGQANCYITARGYGSGQANASILGSIQQFAQAQADILTAGYASGQANADIKQVEYGHGQSQADILHTYTGSGQAQCTVVGNAYGQSQADIRQTYYGHGQAQADIKATYYGHAQAQCDIKAVGYGSGQAQCDVKAVGYGSGQAQCDVMAVGYGSGQANCDIKAKNNGYGQAQCSVLSGTRGYGQAQCDVKAVGYGSGQAQCDVKTTGRGFGQAQCDVRVTQYGFGQCQAWIKQVYYGHGQAQCDIKAVGYGSGQAQCDVRAVGYGSGQAQCDVRAVGYSSGQAQCYIQIINIVNGQAQADIKATSNNSAQAQADIKAKGAGYGNAQALIATNVTSVGQAQATIKVFATGSGQAQASIINGVDRYAQAQALIRVVDINNVAQAQALIIKSAGYGQAQALIFQTHTLKSLTVNDRATLGLTLNDRAYVTLTIGDRAQGSLTISDRPITLSIGDRQTISMELNDREF